MDWLRRVHRNINDGVVAFLGLRGTPGPPTAAGALELECDKLTPEQCGRAGALVSRGSASRVRVDCLLYDDDGMARLQTVVPLSKIEMDFSELFRVSDDDLPFSRSS